MEGALHVALRQTFEMRATHPLPTVLPAPPPEWETPYRRLSTELAIPSILLEAHRLAGSFLDPVLAGSTDPGGAWDPTVGAWTGPPRYAGQ